jgi:hypothetical protein
MIDNDTIHKLSEVIPRGDLKSLQDIAIFQDENGDYCLFNKYVIHKTDGMYKVNIDYSFNTYTFSSLKNAAVWCTLDKRNKILEASNMLVLDQRLAGLDAAIVIHSHLVKKAKNDEDKLIYLSKLSQERAKKRKVLSEIDHYIRDSKRWQLARMTRKPAH